jgi:hypothetical protein
MSPEVCKNLLGFGTKLTDIGGYRRTGIRGYILTGSIYVCYYLGREYGKLSDVSTGRFRQITGRDSAGLQTESIRLFGICCIFIFPVDLKTDPVSIPVLLEAVTKGRHSVLLFVWTGRVRDSFCCLYWDGYGTIFFSGNVGCILETAAETLPCLRRWLVNGYGIGRIRSRWLYYWIDGYGYRICSDSRRVYWDGCGGIFYFRICCATW